MSSNSSLKEWVLTFIKNRDLFFKKIASIKEEGNKVIVENKDNSKITYYIIEDISLLDLKNININDKTIICVLNTKSNIDSTIKIWHELVKYKMLSIMYINPKEVSENKWSINPYYHSNISDASLKNSLLSIFSTTIPYGG